MKYGYIYTLVDPISSNVRYIGQTIVPLNKRLTKHISDSKRISTHVNCWIKGLIAKGVKPLIFELERCLYDELDKQEIYYIDKYKSEGFNLTNIALGGQVRRIIAQETKDKISKSLKGIKQSEETKEKRRQSLMIAWASPELRALKSRQTSELNKAGITGTKGKISKRKGKPFCGDKEKLSKSLKRHYSKNGSPRKLVFENLDSVISDYRDTNIPLVELSKKYGCSRVTLTKIMKESNIPLRNGKKNITKDQLYHWRIIEDLSVKQIASNMNCSTANVEKFIKRYSIYKGGNIKKRA